MVIKGHEGTNINLTDIYSSVKFNRSKISIYGNSNHIDQIAGGNFGKHKVDYLSNSCITCRLLSTVIFIENIPVCTTRAVSKSMYD